MWWWVGGGAVALVAFLGVGAWMLGPTLRTFRGPDFEPTYRDEASIDRAQQSGPESGLGAGGGGV